MNKSKENLIECLSDEYKIKALRAYYNYQISKEETKQVCIKYMCAPLIFILLLLIALCFLISKPLIGYQDKVITQNNYSITSNKAVNKDKVINEH